MAFEVEFPFKFDKNKNDEKNYHTAWLSTNF